MLSHRHNLAVHVLLERRERLGRVFRVPDWTGGHAKDLRPVTRLGVEVLAHDAIVSVVLPTVMTFVEDQE
jgi:hypothetical protein